MEARTAWTWSSRSWQRLPRCYPFMGNARPPSSYLHTHNVPSVVTGEHGLFKIIPSGTILSYFPSCYYWWCVLWIHIHIQMRHSSTNTGVAHNTQCGSAPFMNQGTGRTTREPTHCWRHVCGRLYCMNHLLFWFLPFPDMFIWRWTQDTPC